MRTFAAEEDSFRQVLAWHAARYPLIEVQDLYKLVYQGAFGSEHAAADGSRARAWLEREVSGLGPGRGEPKVEPVSANGSLVRVNLRPYTAGGGSLETLLDAFLRTAQAYRGTEEQFRSFWHAAESMAEEGALALSAADLRHFFAEMECRGFPAAHHSEAYRNAYRPAYRVAAKELLVQA